MKKLYLLTIVCLLPRMAVSTQTDTTLLSASKIAEVENSINDNVKGTFSIDVEQDYFVDWMPNKNFDRNYTQGTGFSYTKPELDKTILFLPINVFNWFNNLTGRNVNLINYPSTIAFGVTAFTPRIIDSPAPIVGDRPFAGLMFMSTVKNQYNQKSKAMIQTSFNYGILGTNITNTFQSYVHKHVVKGRPTEISWNHQISEGGSFAFLFSHNVSKSVLSLPTSDTNSKRKWLDWSIGYQVDIGWYTGAALSTKLKIGLMTPYSMSSNEINTILEVGRKFNNDDILIKKSLLLELEKDSLDEKGKTKLSKQLSKNEARIAHYNECKEYKTWDAFLFFSLSPRLTPYNSFILGQPQKTSIYTLNYEDYNPFIVDFEYGIVVSRLHIKDKVALPVKRFDIILSINHRSPEIRNEEFKRWHHWGRISIRFPLF